MEYLWEVKKDSKLSVTGLYKHSNDYSMCGMDISPSIKETVNGYFKTFSDTICSPRVHLMDSLHM